MKKENKNKLKDSSIVLILGIIYLLITILAVMSYTSQINRLSTNSMTFGTLLESIWWQIVMIILFMVTFVLYNKNKMYGAILEVIMGVSMIVYIIVSIVTIGVNFLAIFIELILPIILITHGYIVVQKLKRKDNKNKKTI